MEKKNFPEKENQPLSNHRSDCYIYIYERWHPLTRACERWTAEDKKERENSIHATTTP